MICIWKDAQPIHADWIELQCIRCERRLRAHVPIVGYLKAACLKPETNGKVGSEFRCITESLHLHGEGCNCIQLMHKMDSLGVVGCTKEFDSLVADLDANKSQFGLQHIALAAANAVLNGLAFKVNWADPIPGLLQEAIRRAT